MRHNDWLMSWIVKGVVTIFNFPATWFVFYDMFEHTGRPGWLAYFNTFMAVLAVDVIFLWIIGILEDEYRSPIKRLPAAITSIVLAILVVWIGVMDEGTILAFAPRMGLLLLVFNDLIAWLADYRAMYFSREFQEEKIRNEEVIARRKMNKKTRLSAMDKLEPVFENKHRQRILDQLNVKDTPVVKEPAIPTTLPEVIDLPENIFQLADGSFGWVDQQGNEIVTTKTGKPYKTARGAQIALARSLNNGQSV